MCVFAALRVNACQLVDLSPRKDGHTRPSLVLHWRSSSALNLLVRGKLRAAARDLRRNGWMLHRERGWFDGEREKERFLQGKEERREREEKRILFSSKVKLRRGAMISQETHAGATLIVGGFRVTHV